MQARLSAIQKAILREGLVFQYNGPLFRAHYLGLVRHWELRGGHRYIDELGPDAGFDVRYAMGEKYPHLWDYISQSFWDPTRGKGATERREALLCVRSAVSRSLRRLVERGLIQKLSARLWRLTPAGAEVAAMLFPEVEKPSQRDIDIAYRIGLENRK